MNLEKLFFIVFGEGPACPPKRSEGGSFSVGGQQEKELIAIYQ